MLFPDVCALVQRAWDHLGFQRCHEFREEFALQARYSADSRFKLCWVPWFR